MTMEERIQATLARTQALVDRSKKRVEWSEQLLDQTDRRIFDSAKRAELSRLMLRESNHKRLF